MPLSKLIVGGFKSIRETTEIPIAPLTLLFGPNSAGKSAIVAAIDQLAATLHQEESLDRVDLFARMTRAIRAQTGYAGPAYQHPRDRDDQELEHTPTTLGAEIDDFGCLGTNFNGVVDESQQIALDLYWTLQGKAVRIENTEASSHFFSTVSVEGAPLLQFCDAATWLRIHPVAAEILDVSSFGGKDGPFLKTAWDALLIHTDHSFWIGSALAAKFDEIKIVAAASESVFVRQAITVEEGSIIVRTSASTFGASGLGQTVLGGRTLLDVCMHGVAGEGADATAARQAVLAATRIVDQVCASVTFLVDQIRFSAKQELEFTRVAGDRKVLTTEDVTTEFAVPGDLHIGPNISDYVRWLGLSLAGKSVVSDAVMKKVRAHDDFVNDELRRDLFSTRRYLLKAEVWRIETEHLLPRDPDWGSDDGERLKVTLYLEDAHGRKLDFADVGSGISYVIPVLVSLWGADRSWIEQPELHLHPAAQCELGDVIIRAFNRGRFSVIETHSEHLLLRVLRRIRQTSRGPLANDDPELKCHPEAVSILYFEPLQDGSTTVRPIRLSRGGDFMDRWPQGFFTERDRELFDE